MKADNGYRSKSASLVLLFLGLAAVALTGFLALLWIGAGDAGAVNKEAVAGGPQARVVLAATVEPERQAPARRLASGDAAVEDEPHPYVVAEAAAPDPLQQNETESREEKPYTEEKPLNFDAAQQGVMDLYGKSLGNYAFTKGRSSFGLDSMVPALEEHPLVKDALGFARSADPAQREALLETVSKMSLLFLQEAPPLLESGEPWIPAHSAPGGVTAYALLFAELDADGRSLEILVQLADVEQSALQEIVAQQMGGPTDRYIFGEMGRMAGYACDRIIGRLAADAAYLAAATPQQEQVLAEFRELHSQSANPSFARENTEALLGFARVLAANDSPE